MELNHHRTGRGEPLVLIHGIGSRWQMWEPVIEPLAATHDVIALDLPGFGASPLPPPGTPAGPGSLATLVEEFLAGLGVSRPHVAGNSLGGLVALELARRGSVRTATGVSPAGFAGAAETVVAQSLLRVTARVARRLAPSADRVLARPAARKLMLNLFFAHPERTPGPHAAADMRALAGAPWFDETLRAIRPLAFSGGDQIQVPVTIAWGERDRLLLPRQARRAAREIPAARIVKLTGCGHVPTFDDPEQVTRVLLEAARG